ncbi:unnamed protein product [Blepharisma stoltei]|uniref:Gustatory receptor n=1 Tax=Blepharisma stoltei TaxID=1481888 RepID=A0AAU9I6Q9_9CILI|nr:unnamed protein product [Blepharisma stoltei]
MKYVVDKFDPDIFNEMTLIPIIIFSLLTLIYVLLFRDMRKLDMLTGKFLKAKSRFIIKSIKKSIESVVYDTNFNTIKKIKKDLERMKTAIIQNSENFGTRPIEDKNFANFLLTKDRIIKHSKEALFNIHMNEIRPIIENLEDENQEFQELIAKIKPRKKCFARLVSIFKTDPNEARIFKLVEENNNQRTKLDKKTKKRIIEDMKNDSRNNNHENGVVNDFEQEPNEDIFISIDSQKSWFNYDINSYGFFIKFLENHMKNNYKPEKSFIYYFLQNSLVFGLISFTDLNFTRTARLTLLMINIFLCCWITILFFGAQTYFYSEFSILNFSQVQLVLYAFTLVINQAVLMAGQFLPSNYLDKEYLEEGKKYSNKLSKVSFGVCWLFMIGMFVSSCINAGNLDYDQQVSLIQTIFISMFTTVIFIGVIKPALIALHKTIGIQIIIKRWLLACYAAFKRMFCCKRRENASIHPENEDLIINAAEEQI